jgi:NitT/TauT family transport system permease protein
MLKKQFGNNSSQIIFIVFIFILWEIISYCGIFDKSVFPTVEEIFGELLRLIFNGKIIIMTIYSIGLVLFSILISLFLVLLFIYLSNKSKFIKNNMEMLNAILSPLPGIAILPIIILWVGTGVNSLIFIMVHSTLWPIWSNLFLSFNKINAKYSRLIKVYKISFIKSVYNIFLLGMKDDILSSLSISWSRGWRTLLSIEMAFGVTGGTGGLGWLIFQQRMYMDTKGMYASLIIIALCGVIFESYLFKRGEIR